MKLACIVLAHDLPKQLASLLSLLRHPQVRVYLHIDRRKPLAPFTRALDEAGLRDVVVLPRQVSPWGSVAIVDATMEGVAAGVADGCGYFVLLSGRDFPLQPVEEIIAFLEDAGPRSYMHYFPASGSTLGPGGQPWLRQRTQLYSYSVLGRMALCFPRGEDVSFLSWRGKGLNELLRVRNTFKPPRRHPAYVRPFMGSQWWNLSQAAAKHILHFVREHPDYRRYHANTLAADDIFFHSILLGTDFASSHEVVNDDLRFIVWGANGRPITLTEANLSTMVESRKLFARKFDARVDDSVLAQLADRVTRTR